MELDEEMKIRLLKYKIRIQDDIKLKEENLDNEE